jgi:hypothetical protein
MTYNPGISEDELYNNKVEDAMDSFACQAEDFLREHSDGKLLLAAILGQKGRFAELFQDFMDDRRL